MLLYLDTSAFIPLVVDEPSSRLCRRLWSEAAAVCSSALVRVEVAAALARAERLGRLTADQLATCLASAAELLEQTAIVAPTTDLLADAADLAVRLGLRGYDAVHAASALSVRSDETVAAAGDSALIGAWRELGLTTVTTSAGP